jgi:hypothetical protein
MSQAIERSGRPSNNGGHERQSTLFSCEVCRETP